MSANIDLSIFIDDNTINEVCGKVSITSDQSTSISNLKGKVFLYMKGKLHGEKTLLGSIEIADSVNLIGGEEYLIPFKIKCNFNKITYNGKNVSFYYEMEVTAIADEDKEETKGLLKRVTSFIKGNEILEEQMPFYVKSQKEGYRFWETESSLSSGFQTEYVLSVALIVFLALLFFYSLKLDMGHILGGICFSLVSAYLIVELLKRLVLGKIYFQLENVSESEFKVNLSNNKGWVSINKINVSYLILEVVTDQRGTRPETNKSRIYVSKPVEIDPTSNSVSANLSFPPSGLIPQISNQVVNIKWKLLLNVDTSLIPELKYEKEVLLNEWKDVGYIVNPKK